MNEQWAVAEIAEVLGITPTRLLHLTQKSPGRYGGDSQGQHVSEAGFRKLLADFAEDGGGDPLFAESRWQDYLETRSRASGVYTVPPERSPRSERNPPAGDKIMNVTAINNADFASLMRRTEVLAQAVVDLVGIVVGQQQQIVELSRQLESATLLEVQSRIHEQASEHLHKVLLTSAQALKEMGKPIGQVTAGTVKHKGTVKIIRSNSSIRKETLKSSESRQAATRVDVAAEVKRLLGKLAGGGLNASVDTSNAEQRTEELARQNEMASTESFEGDLEIQYRGVSVSVGK